MQFYRHQDTSLKMPPILSYCILHVAMTATVNTRFEKKVPEIMNQNLGQQFLFKSVVYFFCFVQKKKLENVSYTIFNYDHNKKYVCKLVLLTISEIVLNKKFSQNASKFAIFLERENPHNFFFTIDGNLILPWLVLANFEKFWNFSSNTDLEIVRSDALMGRVISTFGELLCKVM